MDDKSGGSFSYGSEPGLRFALLLDGHGGGRPLGWADIPKWRPEQGLLWIHLERDDEASVAWVNGPAGLDPVVSEALLAEESRPRVEGVDDGLLIVLRGVCATAPDQEAPAELDLVPIHIHAEARRVITLRDKGHYITALRDIRRAVHVGKGPCHAGDLLAKIADKLVRDLEPVLDTMEDEVDVLDDMIFHGEDQEVRPRLKLLRRRAVGLRRYLAPQRDALSRLEHDDATWLGERDRVRLREVTDKLMRFTEHLDSIRDRTTILHDDLSTAIGERIARNSNRLAALAALLLPPSVIAGLLGMNVGGIPGVNDSWAFELVVAVTIVISALTLYFLKRINWL
jgi:zinc transporter